MFFFNWNLDPSITIIEYLTHLEIVNIEIYQQNLYKKKYFMQHRRYEQYTFFTNSQILSVPKYTANLYCICSSKQQIFNLADAVHICGNFLDTQQETLQRLFSDGRSWICGLPLCYRPPQIRIQGRSLLSNRIQICFAYISVQ